MASPRRSEPGDEAALPPAFFVGELSEDAQGFLRADFAGWHPEEGVNGGWGAWEVSGVVRIVDGQLIITELKIEPSRFVEHDAESVRTRQPGEWPAAGVTAATLRSIKIGEVLPAIRRELDRATSAPKSSVEQKWAEAAAKVELKRGRVGYPDAHYRRIAAMYLDLAERGETNGIVARIAKEGGWVEATVRDWIRRAEDRGYLMPATRGRGGTRRKGPRFDEPDTGEA